MAKIPTPKADGLRAMREEKHSRTQAEIKAARRRAFLEGDGGNKRPEDDDEKGA
jgi:hypothetical protein